MNFVTFQYGKDVNTLDIDEDQETQQEGAAVEWLGYWTWDRGFAGSNPCYNNNLTSLSLLILFVGSRLWAQHSFFFSNHHGETETLAPLTSAAAVLRAVRYPYKLLRQGQILRPDDPPQGVLEQAVLQEMLTGHCGVLQGHISDCPVFLSLNRRALNMLCLVLILMNRCVFNLMYPEPTLLNRRTFCLLYPVLSLSR